MKAGTLRPRRLPRPLEPRIELSGEIMRRALLPIERMLAIR
jgi:hypothetical protein